MAKQDQKLFVREIAEDLQTLNQILSGWNGPALCGDASPLNGAVASCKSAIGKARWDYNVRLIFRATAGRHPIPTGLKMLSIDMSLVIGGRADCPELPADPLDNLEFNLNITGDFQNTRHHCAWHLDRHISEEKSAPEQREGASNESQERGAPGDEREPAPENAHPRYHFQFGGKHMRAGMYGTALLLGSPRLPHPPLDAVLGVDFVLANFRGTEWTKLLSEDRRYQKILGNSQRRFWRPYVQSLGACWVSSPLSREAWHPCDVWPSMMVPSTLSPQRS